MTSTFDEQGREVREEVQAVASCPVCGKDVELVAETEEWAEDEKTGHWLHESFGCAMGMCCGKLIVDSFDGCFVYDFTERQQ